MPRVFLSIGSNIDPERNVPAGLLALSREVRIVAISTFYRTDPVGPRPQPVFYNGVIEIETTTPAGELKHGILRRIEGELGRRRSADKYAPRPIDMDILLYGDESHADLKIPDPDLAERPFLAVPLHELVPDLVLPGGEAVAQLAARFPNHGMRPLAQFTRLLRQSVLSE